MDSGWIFLEMTDFQKMADIFLNIPKDDIDISFLLNQNAMSFTLLPDAETKLYSVPGGWSTLQSDEQCILEELCL